MLNNSESWKDKGRDDSVYPKAVCAFCEHLTPSKDAVEKGEIEYDYDYLCKKNPTQKTIQPVNGKPIYAYLRRDKRWINGAGGEYELGEPEIEDTEEKYKHCCQVNGDGKCEDFLKTEKKKEAKRKLTIGSKEEDKSFLRKLLPFK